MPDFVPTAKEELVALREKYLLNQASCRDQVSEKLFHKFELRQAYEAGMERGVFYAGFVGLMVGLVMGLLVH